MLTGRAVLDEFEQRLQTHVGLEASTARNLRGMLQAMMQQSGQAGPVDFVQRPQLVVRGLERFALASTRNAGFRSLHHFLRLFESEIGPQVGTACMAEIESAFAGRVAPKEHLVDLNLGGSTKRVRRRVPFTLVDAERLLAAVGRDRSAWRTERDETLVALHIWSGLPPHSIRNLRWESIAWEPEPDASLRVEAVVRRRPATLLVGERAVSHLRAFWRANGQPASGPVLRRVPDTPFPVSDPAASYIVRTACERAGFGGIDRRHLRAPYALWLREQGWDSYVLAQLFGYRRSRDLLEAVRPVEELRAQIESSELLTLSAAREVEADTLEAALADPHSPGGRAHSSG